MLKIGHLLFSYEPGGVESFILQLTKSMPKDEVQTVIFSFYDGRLRQQYQEHGAKTYIMGSWHKLSTWFTFAKLLKKENISVLNCHLLIVSSIVAIICKILNISFILYAHCVMQFSLLTYLSVRLAQKFQSFGIGVSHAACRSIWGKQYANKNVKCMSLGIDLSKFADKDHIVDRYFDKNVKVVANVAGYRPIKNYSFFLDIAAEIIKRNKNIRFLLIGDGTERLNIENKIKKLGIEEYCKLTGYLHDIPAVLLTNVDVFLFTSFTEGLGLALVEAQAAGLYCVYSDTVPKEAIINPQLASALSLKADVRTWADVVLDKLQMSKFNKQEALEIAINSSFNIKNTVQEYLKVWKRYN